MIFNDFDSIVFVGDSVTDQGRAYPIGVGPSDNLGRGYVRLVETMINVWYPELTVRITNMGINGCTSRGMLQNHAESIVELNPDWVSICIGINDVWRQFDRPVMIDTHVLPEEYEANLEGMVGLLRNRVKGIFLMTPYYMETNKNDPMRQRMDEYGRICKKVAEKNGCVYIDLQAAFDKYLCQKHATFYAADRVHPNQIGSMIIAKEFLKHCEFEM